MDLSLEQMKKASLNWSLRKQVKFGGIGSIFFGTIALLISLGAPQARIAFLLLGLYLVVIGIIAQFRQNPST